MDELSIRPETVSVDGTDVPLFSEASYMEVVEGVYIREWQHEYMSGDTDWIAIEEDTTMCAYSDTKTSVTYDIGHAVGRYRGQLAYDNRPNSVVVEDETPRIEGTRIELLTLYRAAKEYESLAVVAAMYELPLTEVVTGLEWINENPKQFETAKRYERLYDDWVSEYWTERPWGYERPSDPAVSFEEYRRSHEE